MPSSKVAYHVRFPPLKVPWAATNWGCHGRRARDVWATISASESLFASLAALTYRRLPREMSTLSTAGARDRSLFAPYDT